MMDWIKSNVGLPAFLAAATTFGFFSLLFLLFFKAFPPESKDILNVMLGTVGSSWTGIVGYYFGSSSGSAKKTEMLGTPTTSTTTTTPTTTVETVTEPKKDI